MGSYALLYIGRQHLVDPDAFRKQFPHPWLIWSPPKNSYADMIVNTNCSRSTPQEEGEPVAIEIVRSGKSAFPFGITVGHSENNDIVLRNDKVSRFHAYFQQAQGQLVLVDAESRNGTFVDGVQLKPTKPFALPPEAVLRFGDLEVRYFAPDRIAAYLDSFT